MTELVVKEVQGGVPCVVSLWGSDGSGILMFSLFVPPPPATKKTLLNTSEWSAALEVL